MKTDLDRRVQIHSTDPLVGGPPLPLLRREFVTPSELFFVRNHGPVPEVDRASFRLEVEGLVRRPLRLSLGDLRGDCPRAAVTATLQCAGNRRSELMKVAPIPGEVPWGADGIGTAVWWGGRLCDVLEKAGLAEGAAHVAFTGLDSVVRSGKTFGFGASVPLEKALAAEVLLADEMNGAELPPAHGFPLRVVVPGYIGARSVKWLGHVRVQAEPTDNHFQRAYRLFAPQVTAEAAATADGIVLAENSVTAVICVPEPDASLAAGPVTVQGYALAGGNRRIARVDVSGDGGRTWTTSRRQHDEPWSWQFWEARLTLAPGPAELVARAWDSAANTQPERPESVWNLKGYMNNAWHRVRVAVR